MNQSFSIKQVLEILKNEVDGDVQAALGKMASGYTMTWMYKSPKREELFPATEMDIKAEMEDVYRIKGRSYDIRNIAEGENTVMVELIESYPDPETGQVYRTPLVLVLEMEDGKIKTGRHYCDPNLSYENLNMEQINAAYRGTTTKLMID